MAPVKYGKSTTHLFIRRNKTRFFLRGRFIPLNIWVVVLHKQSQLLHCTRLCVYRNHLSVSQTDMNVQWGGSLYMGCLARVCLLEEHPFRLESVSIRPSYKHFLDRLKSCRFYGKCLSLTKWFSLCWSETCFSHCTHSVLFHFKSA